MRRQPLSIKRYLLLCAFALFFLATTVVAQRTTDGDNNTPAPTDNAGETDTDRPSPTDATGDETTATDGNAQTTPTADNDDDRTTTDDPTEATTTERTTERTTDEPTRETTEESTPTDSPTTDESSAESTATETGETETSTRETAPPITSTTRTGSVPALPTLEGHYSYPPASVPPTENAPFMKPSHVPEGTFFIAVGAILGAFGIAVLIWRAVVACQLHRSVKRAALAQSMSNDKLSFAPPAAPFYKDNEHGSSPSVNGSAGRGVRRTQRGPIPSSTPSQTNLFFSPTAPGANSASNRDSRFLPSGFYAAGAASQQAGHTHSISLTNLRPDSRGHPRPVGHSPPDSPSLMPRAEPARRNLSSSTVNLNRPTSQRAPSAFLDDLLADQPDQFPPRQ